MGRCWPLRLIRQKCTVLAAARLSQSHEFRLRVLLRVRTIICDDRRRIWHARPSVAADLGDSQ